MAETGAPWQLKFEKVEQRCGYLLKSGIWSDCTFEVVSETNQVVMPAHKLVLAMASPVFETIFYGGLSERNELKISDVKPEAFRALLQYIYTGNTDFDAFGMAEAWSLLYGARKYKLPHLVQECNNYICSILNPGNVCRAYELACLYDETTLMDKCIQIISRNTKEVLKAGSFNYLELNTLVTVCSLDHLNVDSELDLYLAVKKYAEADPRRQTSPEDGEPPSEKLSELRLEPQTSKEKVLQSAARSSQTSPAVELHLEPSTKVVTPGPTADKENLKEVPERKRTIRAAVEKIRFLSLSAKEFAAGPARSGLLTQGEAFAVLMNIASAKCAEPMPTGFSQCREPRKPLSDSNDQRFEVGSLDHIINVLKCRNPSEVENDQRFEVGSLDHIINELKSGDPSQVEAAALATTNMLLTPLYIQQALDRGMLDALAAALTEGNYKCKFYAAFAIRNICGSGSPEQLRVLGASAALEPYCRLLADTGIRSWVLRGLADLLKKCGENNKIVLTKLREIGVPQLLMNMPKDEAEQNGENLSKEIFAIINSEGIQSADDIADAAGCKNVIRDIGHLQDNSSQTTDTVQSRDLFADLSAPAVVDHLPPIAPQAKPPPTSSNRSKQYDPNKHCGVLSAEGKPCLRSLVCKAHSVSLRQLARSSASIVSKCLARKHFDTLLAEHRASRDAGAAAGPAPLVNNSILSAFNGLTTEDPISLAAPLDEPFTQSEDLPPPPPQPASVPVERIERPERKERTERPERTQE